MIQNTVKVGNLYLSSLVLSSIDDDDLSAYATKSDLENYAKLDETSYYVHMLSAEPSTPKDGDLWQLSGSWYIYQDGTSYPIGDDSGLIQQLSARVDGVETALSGKADISSTVLNPVYGGNGQRFSEWTSSDGLSHTIRWNGSNWEVVGEGSFDPPECYDFDATSISSQDLGFTATRTENPIVGYTLGNQNDKPLQPRLSDPQISAIDSIVDERATIFDFGNGDISALNLVGEITVQKLIDAGIHNEDDTWIKDPISVKLGTAVTGIDEYTFFTAMYMTNITFPNSVTHIDNCAFQECHALSSITIPESVESVGASAFDTCYNLTSIIVKGKTQAEAETMFAGAGVSPSIITTWNDASQEWVKEQNYISSVPATYKTYQETVSSLSNDGYATTTYVVKNDGGVAKIKSLTQAEYDAISATADAETLYVITED